MYNLVVRIVDIKLQEGYIIRRLVLRLVLYIYRFLANNILMLTQEILAHVNIKMFIWYFKGVVLISKGNVSKMNWSVSPKLAIFVLAKRQPNTCF